MERNVLIKQRKKERIKYLLLRERERRGREKLLSPFQGGGRKKDQQGKKNTNGNISDGTKKVLLFVHFHN